MSDTAASVTGDTALGDTALGGAAPESAGPAQPLQPAQSGRPAAVTDASPQDSLTTSALTEVLLVTGMSGAGKSTVGAVLEDLGWFVVDNLPPELLGDLIETISRNTDVTRLAVGADVRGGVFFSQLQGAVDNLNARGIRPHVLFLEASDEALVRRFEGSRRPHPLQGAARILDGISRERAVVADLRAEADLVIDTSMLNVHQLAARIRSVFATSAAALSVIVVSFGFKYGIPADADTVADMRFLPNPFWEPELRELTGKDAAVSDYVLGQPGASEFLELYQRGLGFVSAGYLREGKRYATIGIGCTGGKHRSVAMAEELARRLRAQGTNALVVHRDLGRE